MLWIELKIRSRVESGTTRDVWSKSGDVYAGGGWPFLSDKGVAYSLAFAPPFHISSLCRRKEGSPVSPNAPFSSDQQSQQHQPWPPPLCPPPWPPPSLLPLCWRGLPSPVLQCRACPCWGPPGAHPPWGSVPTLWRRLTSRSHWVTLNSEFLRITCTLMHFWMT